MSEVRTLTVKLSNLDKIKEACSDLGLTLKDKNGKMAIENHGITTYYSEEIGRDIVLEKKSDGFFALKGDCDRKELSKLAKKLEAYYAARIIIDKAQDYGFDLDMREVKGKKLKINLSGY